MERIEYINQITDIIKNHKSGHIDRLNIETDIVHFVNINGIKEFVSLLNGREPISTNLSLHKNSFKLIYNFSYHKDDFKEYYIGDLKTDYLIEIYDFLNEKYKK